MIAREFIMAKPHHRTEFVPIYWYYRDHHYRTRILVPRAALRIIKLCRFPLTGTPVIGLTFGAIRMIIYRKNENNAIEILIATKNNTLGKLDLGIGGVIQGSDTERETVQTETHEEIPAFKKDHKLNEIIANAKYHRHFTPAQGSYAIASLFTLNLKHCRIDLKKAIEDSDAYSQIEFIVLRDAMNMINKLPTDGQLSLKYFSDIQREIQHEIRNDFYDEIQNCERRNREIEQFL